MSPIPDEPTVVYHLLLWDNGQWTEVECGRRSQIDGAGRSLSRGDGRIYAVRGRQPGVEEEPDVPFGFYYRGGYYAQF